MKAVTYHCLQKQTARELLVIPGICPEWCPDIFVMIVAVNINDEKCGLGMEEIASVFLELSRRETGMPMNRVTVPAMVLVGMVFPEGKRSSRGEEKDVGVMLG